MHFSTLTSVHLLSFPKAYVALDSLNAVICFAEVNEDKQMKVTLNQLIGKKENTQVTKR